MNPATSWSRCSGCLMGLMCGDALGAPVEFKSPEELHKRYPLGISGMVHGWGGTSSRKAGDITDDSEMALALLHSLCQTPTYSPRLARAAYLDWHHTHPSDEGITTANALNGHPSPSSQANGALMRIAPLAILSHISPAMDWIQAAAEDAAITHPHATCAQANIIYVESLRLALQGNSREDICDAARDRARHLGAATLLSRLEAARTREPAYQEHPGWVEIAFQAAYFHLLHAADYTTGLCAVVNRLGDPDTNGAITGALLGAYFGLSAIPASWQSAVLRGSASRPSRYRAPYGMDLLASLLSRPSREESRPHSPPAG